MFFLGVRVVVVWNEVERAFDILVPFDIETRNFEVIAVIPRTVRLSSLQCHAMYVDLRYPRGTL